MQTISIAQNWECWPGLEGWVPEGWSVRAVGSDSLDRCNFVLGPERPVNGQTGSGPITSCWPTNQKVTVRRPADPYHFRVVNDTQTDRLGSIVTGVSHPEGFGPN